MVRFPEDNFPRGVLVCKNPGTRTRASCFTWNDWLLSRFKVIPGHLPGSQKETRLQEGLVVLSPMAPNLLVFAGRRALNGVLVEEE